MTMFPTEPLFCNSNLQTKKEEKVIKGRALDDFHVYLRMHMRPKDKNNAK